MPKNEGRTPCEVTTAHVNDFLKRCDETIEGYKAHRQKITDSEGEVK